MPDTPTTLYKVLDADRWDRRAPDGAVPAMPIDEADGFMHLSTAGQLAETLELHFRGRTGVVIVAVRASDLGADLKWEPSRGGQLFPHVYGEIPGSAVIWTDTADVTSEGEVSLPDRLK